MENKNLTQEELTQVTGGDECEYAVVLAILQFIDRGRNVYAKEMYKSYINELTSAQKEEIRSAFRQKFGYSID